MPTANVQQKEIIKTEQYRRPKIALTFHTEHDDIYLKYNTNEDDQEGKNVNSQDLTDSIISCQVKNSLEDDAAAFSVVIAGNYHWDRALHQNDIVTIRIMPNGEGETYPENYNYNIMTGMITEVHRVMGFDSDSMLYQINGKSLVQAFQQYQLGLIQEVQSSLSSMGWLWDTNMDLEAMSTSGGSSGGGLVSAKVPSGVEQFKDAPVDSDFGATDEQMVAFAKDLTRVRYFNMSSSDIEKATHIVAGMGFSPELFWAYERQEGGSNATNGNSWLNHFSTANAGGGSWESQLRRTITDVKAKMNNSPSAGGGDPKAYPSGSIGRMYYSETQTPGFANVLSFIKQMGSSGGSGTGGSSSGGSTSGNTNSTQSQISNEMQNSTGVAFWGNDVRTIEHELIDRFIPYMRYSYGPKGYGLEHYLYYDDMESWTNYEKLQDSSQFVNFQGSLYELQQAALNAPFNEMYFDFDYDGKSHLIVRRTPFDSEDWCGKTYEKNKKTGLTVGKKVSTTAIPRNYITSSQVINGDISTSSDQIYSVFNVNPAIANYTGIKNAADLGSLPQFNQSLVNLYGYSVYDMTSLYLGFQDTARPLANPNGTATKKGKNGKKTKTAKTASVLASHGTDYNARDINRLFGKYKRVAINQKPNVYAQKLADVANNISGNEAAKIVTNYIDNGKVTQTGINGILNTANGGGYPATGSEPITYQNWLDIAKTNTNNNKNYYRFAKGMFNNAEDEVLAELKLQFNNNGDKLSKKQFNSILKQYKVIANTVDVGTQAQDLQYFTAKLYNWYCENINFYSGDLTVKGSPEYRIGTVLVYNDKFYGSKMECYVESVEHVFSLTDGYQTTLGLTRGLDNDGADRFTHLWGKHQDFLGGYMGEASFNNLAYAVNPTKTSSDGNNLGGDGSAKITGPIANATEGKALNYALNFVKSSCSRTEYYSEAGRQMDSPNILSRNTGSITLDCSSFVNRVYDHIGIKVGSYISGAGFAGFHRISSGEAKAGDLIALGGGAHVGFYLGGGNTLCWNGPHKPTGAVPKSVSAWKSFFTSGGTFFLRKD